MTSRLPKETMNSPINAVNNSSSAAEDNECTVREQDRFMPIANVIRIMRKILPPHAKISDDAKETIQECVSEYISFITGEANDRCQREQRKTITAEDVLWAMSKLGFDDYIEPLTMYLHRYREIEGDQRGGSLRGEPLGKRTLDYGATATLGVGVGAPAGAAFAQTVSVPYHIGLHHHHHHHHPNGYYGSHAGSGVPMREPTNGNNGGGSSQGPIGSVEPNGQFK